MEMILILYVPIISPLFRVTPLSISDFLMAVLVGMVSIGLKFLRPMVSLKLILITLVVDNPHFKNSGYGIVLHKIQTKKSKTMTMNRTTFLKIAGGTLIAGGIGYMLSDKKNFIRENKMPSLINSFLQSDERAILYLASLAPSGHNTQPWRVKYIEPYNWIIGNDKTKWLPAVDPTQRETILSIGAFLQNLELAANHYGYACQFDLLATTNQDENVVSVKLNKSNSVSKFDVAKIKNRRTVRSNYLNTPLNQADIDFLTKDEPDYFSFIPKETKECNWLNEQTIEANKIQAYRDAAQIELANWIRFSSKDAAHYGDGLTTASMEIEGLPSWLLRNFYDKESVLKNSFREQSIDAVRKQTAQLGGWFLITSNGPSVLELLETGKRMQRLFLKIRERSIALHPMTQILEEAPFNQNVNQSIGIGGNIQFILRMGYLKNYPEPVSLRRPINGFISV
jgi:hypothetical protein